MGFQVHLHRSQTKGECEVLHLTSISLCVVGVQWTTCHLLNISMCEFTTSDVSSTEDGFQVAVYNPTAWTETRIVRFPIALPTSQESIVEVVGADANAVTSQLVPISAVTEKLREDDGGFTRETEAIFDVVFEATVAPMGVELFQIHTKAANQASTEGLHAVPSVVEDVLGYSKEVENEFVRLRYSADGSFVGMGGVVICPSCMMSVMSMGSLC